MGFKKAASHIVSEILVVLIKIIAFFALVWFVLKKFNPFSEGTQTASQKKVEEAKDKVSTVIEKQEEAIFTAKEKAEEVKDEHEEVKSSIASRRERERQFFREEP